MAKTFKMKFTGGRELERALETLPKRMQKGAVRRALKKAAQPIADDAQSRIPVESGELKRKLTVATQLTRRQRRRRRDRRAVAVYIGAQPARHAHLVEFGTAPRVQATTGRSTGRMPAQPFLRPAWDSGHRRALAEFARLLWVEIEKAAKRLAKKQARS